MYIKAILKAMTSHQNKTKVSAAGNWYDLSVTTGTTGTFERRFMGRMETGETTTSDPAMVSSLRVARICHWSSLLWPPQASVAL